MYTVCLVTQKQLLKQTHWSCLNHREASPNVDVPENTAFLSQLNPVC